MILIVDILLEYSYYYIFSLTRGSCEIRKIREELILTLRQVWYMETYCCKGYLKEAHNEDMKGD